jgi:hypothetical protein
MHELCPAGRSVVRSKPVGGWLRVCTALLVAACTSPSDPPPATGAPVHPTTTVGRAQAELDLQLTRQLPQEYSRACARLRSYRPLRANACPPLVPQGAIKIEFQGSPRGWPRSYQLDLASRSLSSIGGRPVESAGGHWTVAAARGRTDQRLLALTLRPSARRPSTCRLTNLEGEPVTACRVPPYEEGGGYYGGHIAYEWKHEDVVYHITIHGYANEPRVSLMMAALIARETGP